jgi:hypothetical protein
MLRVRLLWLLSLVFVVWMIWAETSFQYFEAPVASELQLSATNLALVSAAFLLPYGLMQIPVGWLLDRGVAERWLIGAALAAAVLTATFGLSGSFAALLVSRAGMGLACAVAFPASALLAYRSLPPRRFALAIGFTDSLLGVGASLSTLTFLFLQPEQWRRLALLQSAVLMLLVALPALALARRQQQSRPVAAKAEAPKRWSGAARRGVLLGALIYAWGGGMIFGLGQYGLISGLQQWTAALRLTATFALSLGLSFGMVGAGLLGGAPRRRAGLLLAGALVALAAFLLLVRAPLLADGLVVLIAAVLGLGVGTAVLAFPLAEEAAPAGCTAMAAASVNAAGTLTGALMTVVSGVILQVSPQGSTDLVVLIYGGLGGFAVLLAWLALGSAPAREVSP